MANLYIKTNVLTYPLIFSIIGGGGGGGNKEVTYADLDYEDFGVDGKIINGVLHVDIDCEDFGVDGEIINGVLHVDID